jgi:hypothetical protein
MRFDAIAYGGGENGHFRSRLLTSRISCGHKDSQHDPEETVYEIYLCSSLVYILLLSFILTW